MAVSSIHRGFRYEPASSRLSIYYNGTRITNVTASGMAVENGNFTSNAGVTSTTGNIVATAGDLRATVGNLRLGPVNAFGTTEPTQAMVFEAGTAPAGAITTSGGLFSSATVVQKIIADGTVSNVET